MKIIRIFTGEAKERIFHGGELDITCVEWKIGKQIIVLIPWRSQKPRKTDNR